MIVFLNGRFVSESRAVVPVSDRGFLYGDGVFETMRVCNGRPFRWAQHFERLKRGAKFLGIRLSFTREELAAFALRLIQRNRMPDSMLRLNLSRGTGRRGYSPKGAGEPTLVMSLHPATDASIPPPRWKLITSTERVLAGDPLTQFKTCNKLPQILARAEADRAGADEALLLNNDGMVAEASSANVFWIQRGTVCTPPLSAGVLPGVTRALMLKLCGKLGLPVAERNVTLRRLKDSAGVFLTLSSWGLVEAATLDGRRLQRSPVSRCLRDAYADERSKACPPAGHANDALRS